MNIEDRVQYAVSFIRAIGAQATKDGIAHWKGTIKKITDVSPTVKIASVEWDNGYRNNVNMKNIAKI